MIVNVIEVDALIDEVVASFPTMVIMYVPFAAVPEDDEDEDLEVLEHPAVASPTTTRSKTNPANAKLRER